MSTLFNFQSCIQEFTTGKIIVRKDPVSVLSIRAYFFAISSIDFFSEVIKSNTKSNNIKFFLIVYTHILEPVGYSGLLLEQRMMQVSNRSQDMAYKAAEVSNPFSFFAKISSVLSGILCRELKINAKSIPSERDSAQLVTPAIPPLRA